MGRRDFTSEEELVAAIVKTANSGDNPRVQSVVKWVATINTVEGGSKSMSAEGEDRLEALENLARDLGADYVEDD